MSAALVDVDAVKAPAFALAEKYPLPFSTAWHTHRKHQLLYAAAGILHLEADGRQWLLPPQRAAWIRGSMRHRVRGQGSVLLHTIYVSTRLVSDHPVLAEIPCRVFPAQPLLRELMAHAMRWGPKRDPTDRSATRFFGTCVDVCAELCASALPLWLPTASTPEVRRAIEQTLEHLGEKLSQAEVARLAGLSERSLSRKFLAETKMTWGRFLQAARLLRAMELLSVEGAQVTQVAYQVGFESLAAFTRAFERLAGEAPRDYRKRMAARPPCPTAAR